MFSARKLLPWLHVIGWDIFNAWKLTSFVLWGPNSENYHSFCCSQPGNYVCTQRWSVWPQALTHGISFGWKCECLVLHWYNSLWKCLTSPFMSRGMLMVCSPQGEMFNKSTLDFSHNWIHKCLVIRFVTTSSLVFDLPASVSIF